MFNTLILQQQLHAQAESEGNYSFMILLVGFILIFYFFMIRPQQKKQKDQKKFIEEIKKGDEVVTIGGIYGKVIGVEDTRVVLEVDKSTRIVFQKTAISLEASKGLKK